MTPEPDPSAPASARPGETQTQPGRRRASLAARLRGTWRVKVAEGSMLPGIAPGDWLLVDPTIRSWPRRGTVVLFREPDDGGLSLKRVRGLPSERIPFNGGYLVLGADEAWLEADASREVSASAGFGEPIDSNRFGPVPVDLLVGRIWFRYGPRGRIGRIGRTG